ncbi:MAG: phage tail protein [Pyrinomonadaceae bacterium]|nr:phage tail protein [Pyrinomonadaceae bacterium]
MSAPFVAEIRMFAGNFAPTGWALCAGQLMPISQNTALFSLLGTYYGGDGKSTFALPNLQGNTPLGQGQGSGLSDYFLGQQAGSPYVTLLQSEMPFHNHQMGGGFNQADLNGPTPLSVYTRSTPGNAYMTNSTQNLTQMNFQMLSVAGASLPHNNMMPYLTVTFIIALQGVFPARQ